MKHRSYKNFVRSLAVTLVCGIAVVACDQELLDDATFRLWCGDNLCSWKTEQGSVRRAPTWNKADYGVELVDTPTVISQHVNAGTTGYGNTDARCIEFTTMADVDPGAQVTIGMDFDDDGTVDDYQQIAANGFQLDTTQFTAPKFYDGLRIVITKKGVGHAVLAQIRAVAKDDVGACTAAPIVLKDLALGVPCSDDASCHSGVCCDKKCGECCGPVENQASLPNGDTLLTFAASCANGGTCTTRSPAHGVQSLPAQCNGGKHDRPSGAECYGDIDCASNACDGASAVAKSGGLFVGDGGMQDCPNAHYPDPGGPDCFFVELRGGRCR